MRKREYDEVFIDDCRYLNLSNEHSRSLSDIAFKRMGNHSEGDLFRHPTGGFEKVNYQQYLDMTELQGNLNLDESYLKEKLEKVGNIDVNDHENIANELPVQRNIRKVVRKNKNQLQPQAKQPNQAELPSSQNLQENQPPLALQQALQAIELNDKKLEPLEIEFLEKMTSDCKLPIDSTKAAMMKKYTDLLINAVVQHLESPNIASTNENSLLRKCLQTQQETLNKLKQSGREKLTSLEATVAERSRLEGENELIRQKIREYEEREWTN
jgi:hypothetical protein